MKTLIQRLYFAFIITIALFGLGYTLWPLRSSRR